MKCKICFLVVCVKVFVVGVYWDVIVGMGVDVLIGVGGEKYFLKN